MNCIVTAGPTYEPLDEVRRLTNFSTGTLGTELANFLAADGHEVCLLRGHYSTCGLPVKAASCQMFTTTADLRERLQQLGSRRWGGVFHAAAVSDFGFGKIWARRADGRLEEVRSAKISTTENALLAELLPTPKILALLKDYFPGALLAGWKYELDGDRASAIVRAEEQLVNNRTDLCVVNGRAYGEGFGVVTGPGQCQHAAGKPELFANLTSFLRGQSQRQP